MVEAAQHDVAALALVAVERDAGDALDGLGGVLVGEAPDRVGRDDGAQRGRGALLVEGARGAGAGAGDDDALHPHDVFAEHEVLAQAAAGEVDLARLVRIADVAEGQRVAAIGHVRQHVAAVLRGVGFDGAAGNTHAHAGERQAGGRIGDAAGDRTAKGQTRTKRERAHKERAGKGGRGGWRDSGWRGGGWSEMSGG